MADKRSNTILARSNQNSSFDYSKSARTDRSVSLARKKKHIRGPPIFDNFCCHCSLCKNFYRKSVPENLARLIVVPSLNRTEQTLSIRNQKLPLQTVHQVWVRLGDRVLVKGNLTGTVKYIGPLDHEVIAPKTYIGVQLDEPVGLHNGIYKDKRYFTTPRGHGIMVKYEEVRKIKPPTKRPPLTGNTMFPSYDETKARRRSHSVGEVNIETIELRPMGHGRASTAVPSRRVQRIRLVDPKDQDAKRKNLHSHRVGDLSPKQVRRIAKWKEEFGNDEKAEKMSETLKKLYVARDKGKVEMKKEQEEEKALEKEREKQKAKEKPKTVIYVHDSEDDT
ncbi:uncharacterized protein LOC102803606 isoform X2 [Saccoglossus kowalevskii]